MPRKRQHTPQQDREVAAPPPAASRPTGVVGVCCGIPFRLTENYESHRERVHGGR